MEKVSEVSSGVNYKVGDLVQYYSDNSPFKVIGVREGSTEIEGDFSGIGAATQSDWVANKNIRPFVYADAHKWELTSKLGASKEVWQILFWTLLIRLEKPKFGDVSFWCQDLNIINYCTHTNNVDDAKLTALNVVRFRLENAKKALSEPNQTRQNHLVERINSQVNNAK